jgi:anti-anti-sigma regulatory factor
MWSSDDTVSLAVEHPAPGIVVVRVAGVLNRATGPRLARLLDVITGGRGRPRHVVVDLGDVRAFAVAGLDVLRHAEYGCRSLGVGLHVCGLAAREELLPAAVVERLAGLPSFPTVECAVAALAAPVPVETVRAPAPAALSLVSHPRRRPRAPGPAVGPVA